MAVTLVQTKRQKLLEVSEIMDSAYNNKSMYISLKWLHLRKTQYLRTMAFRSQQLASCKMPRHKVMPGTLPSQGRIVTDCPIR